MKSTTAPIIIHLRYCTYAIDSTSRLVTTTFPDGLYCTGTRDEYNPVNIREAESQGYKGANVVWQSLVEHELLHSIVSEVLFTCPSRVLRAECEGGGGGKGTLSPAPLYQRYEEEAITLAMQMWCNNLIFTASLLNRYGMENVQRIEQVLLTMRRTTLAKVLTSTL